MTPAEIIDRLREHAPQLRALGVERAALFGSVARGEAGPDSDIDIGVQLDPKAKLTIYDYVGVKHYLEDMFTDRVDVANLRALYPRIKEAVQRDLIYAF